MDFTRWIEFLRDEIRQYLRSKNPLLWVVFALWLTSTIRTQYGNFYRNDGALDILTSLGFEIIGLVAFLCFLRWKGIISYSFIALYAVLTFIGTVGLIYLHTLTMELLFLGIDTFITITFALEILIVALSIPMFILSSQYLLFTIKMENKLKNMSITDLIHDLFEANAVFWECEKDKDPKLSKIQRGALLDSQWAMHELKKRDPKLEELVRGMTNSDTEARDKHGEKIVEKYGRKALLPLERTWNVRESHYFSKNP